MRNAALARALDDLGMVLVLGLDLSAGVFDYEDENEDEDDLNVAQRPMRCGVSDPSQSRSNLEPGPGHPSRRSSPPRFLTGS
jgi:hypothetical protein